jgi:hypothetical protein
MVEKQNQLCAGTNDHPGEGRADAAAGAGDENDLARASSVEWVHRITAFFKDGCR